MKRRNRYPSLEPQEVVMDAIRNFISHPCHRTLADIHWICNWARPPRWCTTCVFERGGKELCPPDRYKSGFWKARMENRGTNLAQMVLLFAQVLADFEVENADEAHTRNDA